MKHWPKKVRFLAIGPSPHGPSGIALLQAIMTVGIGGLIVAGLTVFLSNRAQEKLLKRIQLEQRQLVETVLAQISQPSSILASSAGNTALTRCLFQAGTCAVTDSAQPLGVAFTAKEADATATGVAKLRAGTPATPVYYDNRGRVCVPADPFCIYQAVAFFRAVCPNHTANCPLADEIETRVVVGRRPGALLSPTLPLTTQLFDQPRAGGAVDTTFRVRTFVKDITGAKFQVCSPGAVQTGVLADGHISCKCAPEYPQLSFNTALQMPVCAVTNRCPIGQEMRGLQGSGDPNPGQPVCVMPKYNCQVEGNNFMGRHSCTQPKQQLRATSANPFVGCIVNYPSRKDHINVVNPSLSCPPVRIDCCEAPHNGT